MKKAINNKIYDTNTAINVGEWWNRLPCNDLNFCAETLYRKKTGEFFLHGEGGPMSKYVVQIGNNEWSGGEKIIPLSYEAAQKWAQEHLDGDEYCKIFEIDDEENGEDVIHLRISADAKKKLDIIRAKEGRSYRDIIDQLIHDNL